MAERLEFREKLAGILTLCESQNNITDKATVEAYFAEDNLSAEQMELVFDYLLSKKVIVKGYVKAGGSIKNAENTEEPIRYTQEEQDYLRAGSERIKRWGSIKRTPTGNPHHGKRDAQGRYLHRRSRPGRQHGTHARHGRPCR